MNWTALTQDQLPIIAGWLDDLETARYMAGILPLDEWFSRASQNPDYHIWMIRDDDMPIGCLILEVINRIGHLALIVSLAHRGKGYGRGILAELFEQHVAVRLQKVIAHIRQDHTASQRCFQAAGFERETIADADGYIPYAIRPQRLMLEKATRIRYSFPPELNVPDSTELFREDRDGLH